MPELPERIPYALFCDRWLPWHRIGLLEEMRSLTTFAPHCFPRMLDTEAPPWESLHPLPKGRHGATSPSSRYAAMAAVNPRVVSTLRDLSPAFIHAQGGRTGLNAGRYADLSRSTLIVSLLGRDLTSWIRPDPYDPESVAWQAGREELVHAAAWFLVGSGEMQELALECGIPASKIFRHRSGIDTGAYPFNRDYSRLAPGPRRQVVMKGRFLEEWGLRYGLKAYAQLSEIFDLRLSILGDGPLEPQLRRLATDLGIADQVTFLEPADPTARSHFATAALALIPSVIGSGLEREFSSRTAMEAAALGIPVVATSHGTNAETIEDGVTGYLVPERDVDALTDRAAFLLEQPEAAAEFAAAGRAKVEFQFDVHRTGRHLEGFFKMVVA